MHPRARDFTLAAFWLALDQATKALAVARLDEPVTVIPGVLRLTLSRNRGGLFGWLGDAADPWRTLALTIVPLAAVGVIAYLLARQPPRHVLSRVGLALILGGAAGNLIDRAILGHVTDFFDAYAEWWPARNILESLFGVNRWPTFNVADSGLTVGATLLIGEILGRRDRHADAKDEAPDPGGTSIRPSAGDGASDAESSRAPLSD